MRKLLLAGMIISGTLLSSGLMAQTAPPKIQITDKDGMKFAEPLSMDAKFKNPVTDEYEKEFRRRAQLAIKEHSNRGKYGNTYFENEKASFPPAMFDVLFGNRKNGLDWLQSKDVQADSWHKITKGIDFYACFTIKNQARKYFYLGEFLEPDYRKRMFEGATLWTEKDPTRRPNPSFKKGGPSWGPDNKNSWVDVRNTDNLRAMRETTIYLFAEETGNEAVRKQYKANLQRYTWALFNIGMGEWDSENYHMHTFAPYLNLYDFAKDPEVKMIAKAALDMLITMGAVKYYEGGFAGPIKREYNKPYVFGGAAGELWHYFGGTPIDANHTHRDSIHIITSGYRPPAAVVELAKKNFDDVEIFAAKPTYETWKVEGNGASGGKGYPQPEYYNADHKPWVIETTYFSKTFQLGTLPHGSFGDLNGFKLLMRDSKKAAQFFTGASVSKASKVNRGSGKDRIAHYKNTMVNMTAVPKVKWSFIMPENAGFEDTGKIVFIKGEKTWLAIHPVNLKFEKPDGKSPSKKWKNLQSLYAQAGDGPSGFAMEVGEEGKYKDFAAFKSAVLANTNLEVKKDEVHYTASNGRKVGLGKYDAWMPVVYRNGVKHETQPADWALYRSTDAKPSPITQGWKSGKLKVEAGGKVFEATFTNDGKYSFTNK